MEVNEETGTLCLGHTHLFYVDVEGSPESLPTIEWEKTLSQEDEIWFSNWIDATVDARLRDRIALGENDDRQEHERFWPRLFRRLRVSSNEDSGSRGNEDSA